MLAIGIKYLNGFVVASEPVNREKIEWPPHPARVFMAMAAAHFQSEGSESERDALLWLESINKDGQYEPPRIYASECFQRNVVTQYVPVNDSNKGFKKKPGSSSLYQEMGSTGLRRNRQPRSFAQGFPENDTVYMVWPDNDPDVSIRYALDSICRKVTRIGHSISMVQMWIEINTAVIRPNWFPDDVNAEIYLRIAPKGTLNYLENQYNKKKVDRFFELTLEEIEAEEKKTRDKIKKSMKREFGSGAPSQFRPNLSIYHGYRQGSADTPDTELQGSVFIPHMMIMRLRSDQSEISRLMLEDTLAISSRWRDALISHASECSKAVKSLVSGHDSNGKPLETPHVAFLPIGFIGSTHADGHLLGMGFALPEKITPEQRQEMFHLFARVRKLKLGKLGVWNLEAVTESRPGWNLLSDTWTSFPQGSRQWSSVTPVVYDRHPKSKDKRSYVAEVARMIGAACTESGLPEPADVIVTDVSIHLGTPPSHMFPRFPRKDGSLRRHTHAIVVFDEPVIGPVVLGAGRYRGYGLFRPIDHR